MFPFLGESHPALASLVQREAPPSAGNPVPMPAHPLPRRMLLALAILPRFGRGFVARTPARMGFSGGPVSGPDGCLRGMVVALPNGRDAASMAALAGFDLDGILHGDRRRVFVVSIEEVTAAGEAA